MPDQSIRAPVKRDMASIERAYAALKSQLQAKQVEVNQKAKVKRDAAKVEATKAVGVASKHETTAAVLAATYKRSMQPGTPDTAKKQRTDVHAVSSSSTTMTYRPPTTSVSSAPVPPAYVPPTTSVPPAPVRPTSVPPTPVRPTSVPPISPQLAQQFYDFGVTTRTSSEPEDKMYMPSKIVSKIMYKALPRVHGKSAGAGVLMTKRDEQVKSETVSPALNPSHSTLDHESHLQDAFSISDEAVTFMQECVTEFLLYFTSESRDLSMMQNRRTKKGVGLSISGANVVESMENLGFTPYARVLAGYNEKVKASQDAAARKKTERKNAAQQRALQTHLAARAAATVAMNASKSAAAGTSADLPYLFAKEQSKSVTPFSRVTAATLSSLGSSLQAVSRNVSASPAGAATAQPAAAATITAVPSNSATDLRQQPQLHQK
ncbi:unnamed protein product [Hyaloperonospora brassicae]|nr:unnamed protein product [Hyaloperonospora brassicae]